MTRPLRSAPITGASPLIRAGPPARTATGAELRIAFAGHARVTGGGCFGARLLPFRSGAAGQVHVASMPDTAWPIHGHPPGSSREPTEDPGFDVVCLCFDTSAAIRLRSSPRPPPDTSQDAFSSIAHHNSLQLMQHEAVWSLPPQGGSEGPTFITRTAPVTRRPITYLLIGLLSLFGTHATSKSEMSGLT